MPSISIVVPVYNAQKYLDKCLQSLLSQTFCDLEIICVNDGSTDGSLDILNKYAQKDKRIKVISKENTGLSGARNTALKNVTGKYLMFVDADDYLEKETCKTVFNEIEKENADAVLFSYMREYKKKQKPKFLFSEEKTVFNKSEVQSKIHRRFFGLIGEELKSPSDADSIVTAWGKLYKSKIILDNNIEFTDTKQIGTEDALFNIHAFSYLNKAVYINKTFYHYRRESNVALTKTYKPNLFNNWQNLFSLMQEYIDKNGLDKNYNVALNNRIALSIIGLGFNILYSNKTAKEKKNEISLVLNSTNYIKAYESLEYKYFPLHWKMFFNFAKNKNASLVYDLLYIMNKLR